MDKIQDQACRYAKYCHYNFKIIL